MPMFIQRAPAAIFAWTLMKTFLILQALLLLIKPSWHWFIPLKIDPFQDNAVCLFLTLSPSFYMSAVNEGRGEIARNEQFLLLPQCFLAVWKTFCHFHQIWSHCLQTLSIWEHQKFIIWERIKDISYLKLPVVVKAMAGSKSHSTVVASGS